MRLVGGLVDALERFYNLATGRKPDLPREVATRLGRFAPTRLLLDLGAGDGQLGSAVERTTGGRVVLCDRNEAKLRRRPIGSWAVRADGAALPFKSEAFAGAFLVDVVHHLDRPVQVMAELARVVQANARIVVLDFQPTSGLTRVLRLLRPILLRGCRFRGPREVRRMASLLGLSSMCEAVDGHEYACVVTRASRHTAEVVRAAPSASLRRPGSCRPERTMLPPHPL